MPNRSRPDPRLPRPDPVAAGRRRSLPLPGLFSIMLLWIFTAILLPAPVASPGTPSREDLEKRLAELNTQLRQEGDQNHHPQVEACMDAMIDIMTRLGYPLETILERGHIRIRYSLATQRYAQGREAALRWLDARPDDLAAWEILGDITSRLNRPAEACRAYKRVYEADPRNPVKLRNYLMALNSLNDRDAALPLCSGVTESATPEPLLLAEAVRSFLRFGQYPQALENADRLEKLLPKDPFVHYARGRAWQEQGEFDKAVDSLLRVPPRDTDWFDARYRLGICLGRLRRFDQAARIFVELLTFNPYDEPSYTQLAQNLARLQKRQGVQVVNQIKKIQKNMALADGEANYLWRNGDWVGYARVRSIAYNQKGMFREAEKLLLQACTVIPESTQARINLAQHYLTTLQACRAEPLYRDLLPQLAGTEREDTLLSLQQVLLRQDRPEEPLRLWEQAPGDSPLKQSLRILIGTYYLEIKGDARQAIDFLQPATDPVPEVFAALGRAFVETGEPLKALEYFNRLPPSFADPATQMARVLCLSKLDKRAEAQILYDAALASQPLPALITLPAEAALQTIPDSTAQVEWDQRVEQVKQTLAGIRRQVIEAHRRGWPLSVPILLDLSTRLEQAGDREAALQYALRAYEGDPGRLDALDRVIGLMTQPEKLFERLNLIQIAQARPGNTQDYQKTIDGTLALIELSPQ